MQVKNSKILNYGDKMKYFAKVKLTSDTPEIEVQYVEREFALTENTGVKIYDKYKISVSLSSGMSGVFNDRVIPSDEGDIIFFRPDEVHFAKVSRTGVHRYFDIFIPIEYFKGFGVSAQKIETFLEHRDKSKGNCIRPDSVDRTKTLKLTESLISVLKENKNFQTLKTALAIFELISLCSEMYHQGYGNVTEDGAPDCVNCALKYISQNFSNKIALENIAVEASCSVVYLSEKFKEYVGCSVYTYLTQYRMAVAERLLKADMSVTEVCYECGFYDSSHFIKIFKRFYGITPLEYKNQHKTVI